MQKDVSSSINQLGPVLMFAIASVGIFPTVHREAKIIFFCSLRSFVFSSLARKDVNIQSPASSNQDTMYTSRETPIFPSGKDYKSKPETNIAQQEQVSTATDEITVAGAGIVTNYDFLCNYVAKHATTAQCATTVAQLDHTLLQILCTINVHLHKSSCYLEGGPQANTIRSNRPTNKFFFPTNFHFFPIIFTSTLFFSMKMADSGKIVLVSCIIDFDDVQV
jgi:hypothetical protein